VQSDGNGLYRIDVLPPGEYNVTVQKDGFSTSTLTGLTLTVAQNAQSDIVLKIGSVQDQVTVAGTALPQVDVTASDLGGLVDSQQVVDLPLNGRNFIDLALLQPGVTNATGNGPNVLKNATYFSSNGAPVRSNLVTLDGAPLMNLTGTTSSAVGTTLGVDGIQEFRVITNAFGAQYGISMGSQTIIASRAGTNKFHGDAFDYLRNQALDASGYFTVTKPKLIRNNFGGSFGGPILRDRTFFYATYEGLRQINGVPTTVNTLTDNYVIPTGLSAATYTQFGPAGTSVSCNPNSKGGSAALVNNACAVTTANPTGTVNPVMRPFISWYPAPNVNVTAAIPKFVANFNQPTNEDYGQIRIDQTFSSKDSIFGRLTIDKAYYAATSSYPGTTYQGVGFTTTGSEQFDTIAWNHVFSPNLLNTYRASYSRTLNVNNPAYPSSFQNLGLVYGQAAGQITVNALSASVALGPQGNAPQGFNENSYNMSDDLNWTLGRHALQIGALFNRIEYYTYNGNTGRGNATFPLVSDLLNGTYSAFAALVPGSDIYREPRFYTYGFYVQDDWRLNSRVTLNLGLRYEANTLPIDRKGANWAFHSLTDPAPTYGDPIKNVSALNFEPRVGAAWNVFGNGKTALRGAFGVYDDVNAGGEAFYGTSSGAPPLSAGLSLPAGTVTSLPVVTPAYNLTPGTVPYGQAIKTLLYNAHQPRMLQWNAAIQQQLSPTTSLTVAYVGTRGQNLWDYEEGNPCTPSAINNGIPSWTSPFVTAPAGVNGGNPAGQLPNPNYGNPGQPKFLSVVCNNVIGAGATGAHFQTATYPTNATFPGTYVVRSSPNPLWGDWISAATNGKSNYNGLQVSVNQRVARGFEAQLAYTYSRNLDESQGTHSSTECLASGGIPSTSLQPARHIFNYGPTCFDLTHSLQASFIYHLPKTNVAGFVGREILSGWWFGNKTAWQSGFAFSPTSNTWRSLDQNLNQQSADSASEYVNYGVATVGPGQTGADGTVNTTSVTFVPYDKSKVIVKKPGPGYVQWFNPLMFTMNPIGQLGTVHKAVLRGPHFTDVDLSVNKDTAVPLFGKNGQLEFRVEMFNIFNHTNFAVPTGFRSFTGTLTDVGIYSEAPLSTAGEITSTVGNPRQIQLSLKAFF
jgi:hypothetical protein